MSTVHTVLPHSPLFAGMAQAQIEAILPCLGARQLRFAAGQVIFPAGSEAFSLGLVLQGALDVVQEDLWGSSRLVTRLAPGQLFAESFVLAAQKRLPVSVAAAQDAAVLLLDAERISQPCEQACAFHGQLMRNLLRILAEKNVVLTQKMEIITQKTIREKVLAYLAWEAQKAGSTRFTIAYDRQALADYLAVDRSALSRILGQLQKQGLISASRHDFVIHP